MATNYGNRGKKLEAFCDHTNAVFHRNNDLRCYRVNVPVKLIKVIGNRIQRAFLEGKAQLDYRGVIKGRSFSYDAKETTHKSHLPMTNIKPHQVHYMEDAARFGEVTFLIVLSTETQKFYICPAAVVVARYNAWLKNKGVRGFGNIPFSDMLEVEAKGFINYLDYLKNFI